MKTDQPIKFGDVLRAERKRKLLTQGQLAKALGTTQQNVGHWEANRSLPKPELHSKLVELFGAQSPVASLAPRGRIYLPATTGGSSAVQAREPTPAYVKKEEQPPDSQRAMFPAELFEVLPPHLHPHLEKKLHILGQTYKVDYLSPKLCIEVKAFPAGLLGNWKVAAMGMHRLSVIRSMIRQQETPDMHRYILAMVKGGDDLVDGRVTQRIMVEGSLLGIETVFLPRKIDLAKLIENAENETEESSRGTLDTDS